VANEIRVSDLADALAPHVVVLGNRDRLVARPASLSDAGPTSVTFCSRDGDEALEQLRATAAKVVVVSVALGPGTLEEMDKTFLLVDKPRRRFIELLHRFFAEPRPSGAHASAHVEQSAQVDASAYLGPGVVVGADCVVGSETVIHANVVLYPRTRIGRRVTIHAGTVIGATGFGYDRGDEGVLPFPHLGGVVIEDDVDIGSNTSIDRGTLGDTVIKRGAKVDNLVHIAHNVQVGEEALVIAHAMVGGSTRIGARALIAPSACIRDVLSIGDDATVGLGAVVVKDVPPGTTVMGVPARPAAEYRAMLDALRSLYAQ
jgi:UDP-3-O-[3-hydroxymyristoyl] glucosamine N-acyltransferase